MIPNLNKHRFLVALFPGSQKRRREATAGPADAIPTGNSAGRSRVKSSRPGARSLPPTTDNSSLKLNDACGEDEIIDVVGEAPAPVQLSDAMPMMATATPPHAGAPPVSAPSLAAALTGAHATKQKVKAVVHVPSPASAPSSTAAGGSDDGADKPLACKFCDYRCGKRAHLVRHEQVHSGDKPFSCSYCSYTCLRKAHLVMHERTHTGEKPFGCSSCEYRCADKSAMVKHERIHSGEKPFKCSLCEYCCSARSNLVVHERVHRGERPFACSVCTYRCSRRSQLAIHMRVHTREKPFKCTQCSYQCVLRSSLEAHVQTHSNATPFECAQCPMKFPRRGQLTAHQRRHKQGQ